MSVTLSAVRTGDTVEITATSDLSGTVYTHWWLDGLYLGWRADGRWSFALTGEDPLRVDVQDTTDAAYDYTSSPPSTLPARRRVWWVRPDTADVVAYRVEESTDDASTWSEIARVAQDGQRWAHEVTTQRLTDLETYLWRVVHIDAAGNDGSVKVRTLDDLVVRTPDAPSFTVSYDSGANRVTFT